MPAIVNANMGYAVGTTDAGQPWYQDGSFSFLSNGRVNREAFRDFSYRAMVRADRQDESAGEALCSCKERSTRITTGIRRAGARV